MKSYSVLFRSLLLLIISSLLSLSLISCKDEENPVDPGDTTVPANIFPLVQGHAIIYGEGTLLNLSSETPIPGTSNGFTSTWTIAGAAPIQTPQPHVSSTMIVDVTSIPAVGVNNSPRQFFIFQDQATGNFDFLTNLGFFFRSRGVYNTAGDSTSGVRGDSLVWIGLAKPSEGLNKEWVAYSGNFTTTVLGPVKLEIVAQFTKGTETIAGNSYTVYKLVATRKLYLGTSTVSASTAKTAEIWLVEGVGPVYIQLIGDDESHGKQQKMTSKNF